MMLNTMATITVTNIHHQYSLRLARPLKVAYFFQYPRNALSSDAP